MRWSDEARRQRSLDVKAGKFFTPFKYQGNDVGYQAKHKFIRESLGKADHCDVDSSHTKGSFEWANLDHKYSREAKDYMQLCRSCHRRYDMGLIKVSGLSIADRGGLPMGPTGNTSPHPMREMRR